VTLLERYFLYLRSLERASLPFISPARVQKKNSTLYRGGKDFV